MADATRWYDAQRVGLGEEFLTAIEAVLTRIEANADAGSQIPQVADDDIRRLLVQRFPYQVIYIRLIDRIQILAIAHERRRPGYWVGRERQ